MKIGLGRVPGDPTHLPIEIIEDIVAFVACHHDEKARQSYLWSLSLVSRQWYSASIKHLYRIPILGTRNFDLFARTIAPDLKSRARAVGLEDLVAELYMGDLAYVTTSSKTARLLRRTRKSLIIFEAPSHSMSTSSLAPISKLMSLQRLYLDRDKYDFEITALLRAVHPLVNLTHLSLPRGALNSYPDSSLPPELAWPPALECLQVRNTTPHYVDQWQSFITHLPKSLRTLAFHHMRSDARFGELVDSCAQAPQIRHLIIESDQGVNCFRECDVVLADFLCPFPGLLTLSISEAIIDLEGVFSFPDEVLGHGLQELQFLPANLPFRGEFNFLELFNRTIKRLAQLHQIVVPMSVMSGNERALEVCDLELVQRWPDLNRKVKGVFVVGRNGIVSPLANL